MFVQLSVSPLLACGGSILVQWEDDGVWTLLVWRFAKIGFLAICSVTWVTWSPLTFSSLPLTLWCPFIYSVNIWVTVYVSGPGGIQERTIWQVCPRVAYSLLGNCPGKRYGALTRGKNVLKSSHRLGLGPEWVREGSGKLILALVFSHL